MHCHSWISLENQEEATAQKREQIRIMQRKVNVYQLWPKEDAKWHTTASLVPRRAISEAQLVNFNTRKYVQPLLHVITKYDAVAQLWCKRLSADTCSSLYSFYTQVNQQLPIVSNVFQNTAVMTTLVMHFRGSPTVFITFFRTTAKSFFFHMLSLQNTRHRGTLSYLDWALA